ncbi:MAG: hypothetical protein ABI411_13775 [Tahibacter sp.]
MRIVVAFEAIDIDGQRGQRPRSVDGPARCRREHLVEAPPIRDTGQAVEIRGQFQALVGGSEIARARGDCRFGTTRVLSLSPVMPARSLG